MVFYRTVFCAFIKMDITLGKVAVYHNNTIIVTFLCGKRYKENYFSVKSHYYSFDEQWLALESFDL